MATGVIVSLFPPPPPTSITLFHLLPVPNKLYGFCGRYKHHVYLLTSSVQFRMILMMDQTLDATSLAGTPSTTSAAQSRWPSLASKQDAAASGHMYFRWTGINAVSVKYDCSGVDRTGQHTLQVSSPCSDTARGQPTAEAVGTH